MSRNYLVYVLCGCVYGLGFRTNVASCLLLYACACGSRSNIHRRYVFAQRCIVVAFSLLGRDRQHSVGMPSIFYVRNNQLAFDSNVLRCRILLMLFVRSDVLPLGADRSIVSVMYPRQGWVALAA